MYWHNILTIISVSNFLQLKLISKVLENVTVVKPRPPAQRNKATSHLCMPQAKHDNFKH